MAGIIDFSAHGVFETSTSEIPLTESDWRAAGLASINLIGSATLITSAGTGPDDAEWVSDPEWRRWAQTMQSAGISAGAAIAQKDRSAYLNAASRLADACRSCHNQFRPEAPLSNSQFAENVRRGLDLDR
jgi:cytochrome c553